MPGARICASEQARRKAVQVNRGTGRLRGPARRSAALLAALPLLLAADIGAAQDSVSRAVVQPLPPPAAGDLGAALRRLAGNPRDFAALVDAGTASLALNDIDAAVGFFGRAQELRSGDPRVSAGLAAAYLRSDRAVEAVQLFAEAERGGGIPPHLAGDRGLAYDLVGDNASAQAQYRAVLARGNDPEIVRRLALSLAIAGDKKGFEATLLPQLQSRDFAAYRVRAFGLAILGEEEEAVTIAQAVMPRDLSNRVEPYLRYMPRLTRAQQAAAANLGNFPRAAQIGRDDPRLAQYSNRPAVRTADARLAPTGEPLGPRSQVEDTRSQRRRPGRESSTTQRVGSSAANRLAQVARDGRPRDVPSAATRQPAPPPPPPPPAAPPPAPRPETRIGPAATVAAPGFDLARAPQTAAPAVELPPVQPVPAAAPPPPPPPPPPPVEDSPSVADAFADFQLTPSQTAAAAAGAVDITAIEVRRELEKPPPPPPPPPPPKPKHPSREWVQVATGKDLKALAFDWRRFGRTAPALLGKRNAFTTPWGVSRRLLTGPFESEKAAQKFVTDLKAAGLDAFTFTSEEGQEIAPLK